MFLVILLVACGDQTNNSKQNARPTIKVGVSLPLTGDIAYMGQALKGAVDVAAKNLKADNSLKNNYEFIIEDNAYNTKNVIAINNKFAYVDKSKCFRYACKVFSICVAISSAGPSTIGARLCVVLWFAKVSVDVNNFSRIHFVQYPAIAFTRRTNGSR